MRFLYFCYRWMVKQGGKLGRCYALPHSSRLDLGEHARQRPSARCGGRGVGSHGKKEVFVKNTKIILDTKSDILFDFCCNVVMLSQVADWYRNHGKFMF